MSTRKIIFLLLISFIGAILIVSSVVVISGVFKNQPQSFLREYPPHPIREREKLDLKVNSYYLAGSTENTLYLGSYSGPLHLIKINVNQLSDTVHVTLKLPEVRNQKFWTARVYVDSPAFFLYDGVVPALFRGTTEGWTGQSLNIDSIYFREIVPLTGSSFAIKALNGNLSENVLGKVSLWSPYLRIRKDILQKQLDGIFCTDGMLRYNRSVNRLVYLYYYRNGFMIMDTSLNVIKRGHTLDTITRARIKVARIESENSWTLASPPYVVNRASRLFGKWLMVNSNLLARNENQKAFDQGAAIDVYDIESGRYKSSFYIYHLDNERMNDFILCGNKLIAIYDTKIASFDIETKFFQ